MRSRDTDDATCSSLRQARRPCRLELTCCRGQVVIPVRLLYATMATYRSPPSLPDSMPTLKAPLPRSICVRVARSMPVGVDDCIAHSLYAFTACQID